MAIFEFLLDAQNCPPETSPFLSAQMAVLISFFQLFICSSTWDVQLWPGLQKEWSHSQDRKIVWLHTSDFNLIGVVRVKMPCQN